MQLPHPDATANMCDDHGITVAAERELLVRASQRYWAAQDMIADGHDPRIDLTDQAEWQTAEAIWMAVGVLEPVMSWPWKKLDALLGEVLAGEVWTVGAATGNGKSTFIANLIDGLITRSRGYQRMTIAPLEQSPATFKAKLACLRLDYDVASVFRGHWWKVGDEAICKARLREEIARQGQAPLRETVRYCPADALDRDGLARLIEQAHEWHHRLVIVDHLHHMDHGPGPENRGIRDTMKLAKAMVRRTDMAVIFTAQLNRGDTRDRRRKFYPPELADLQGASAIEQVSDGVALLYRPLQEWVKVGEIDEVIMGQREFDSVFQPNRVAVRRAKHRLDGAKRNEDALLAFQHGRILDEPMSYLTATTAAPEHGDAHEGE